MPCNDCGMKKTCLKDKKCDYEKPKYGKIKHVVGVISGKGGVGKSTVTGILAVNLRKLGKKVAVLDGDITGPSIPRFFGAERAKAGFIPTDNPEEFKMMPVETQSGIKIQSMNLMIDENEPVIWRGPMITNFLVQMFRDTMWDDLDYLLIDMPPGTGDIALTVMQSLPIDYFVVVSTPQNMVSMIVNKVVKMIEKMNIPIKGVVENMAYIECEHCTHRMNVFSHNTAQDEADKMGLKLLAELPIDPDFSEALENGMAENYAAGNDRYLTLMEAFRNDEEEIYERNAKNKKKMIKF